jgi:hypothetical protein
MVSFLLISKALLDMHIKLIPICFISIIIVIISCKSFGMAEYLCSNKNDGSSWYNYCEENKQHPSGMYRLFNKW